MSVDNVIKLKFDNTISRLSGSENGQEVFNSQIRDKLESFQYNDDHFYIEFPHNIKSLSPSFVQGIKGQVLEIMTKKQFFDRVTIEGSEKLKERFIRFFLY